MKKFLAVALLATSVFNLTQAQAVTISNLVKQEEQSKKQIILTIDNKISTVFGETVENDVPPIIKNSRTMVPSRFVADSLGANVEWNAEKREVKITKDGTEILLTIDSNIAKVNGADVTIDSPAIIENERTYTPARIICESLGADVAWNGTEKKITITLIEEETLFFGSFEQDGTVKNGKEPIEWIVLERKDNVALAISKYGLFTKEFNESSYPVWWGSSSLKKWLDNGIEDYIFTDEEQNAIYGDKNRIYILSPGEAKHYFNTDIKRQCKATEQAKQRGAAVDENGNCYWWLAAIGTERYLGACVMQNGQIHETGRNIALKDTCIRPVVILDLNVVNEINSKAK